jgi:shikimate dehydrogenase
MRIFGLIGNPLSHSFSEKYFTDKFQKERISDVKYCLFPLSDIHELSSVLNDNPSLAGLNVTIPYKQSVIDYLDEIDSIAAEINAVNTIKIQRKGKYAQLKGFNTDVFGFEKSIQPLLKPVHTHALILGTGGAAHAVKYVLMHNFGISTVLVSRNPSGISNAISYEDITEKIISEHKLIINASPCGMYPDLKTTPSIPYQFITPQHLLYDLVYNPAETVFLKKGKQHGAQIKNGLDMLLLQAEKSWDIWNNEE